MAVPQKPYSYCPHCGTELQSRMFKDRERATCTRCGFIHYMNPVVGVAVIAFKDDQLVLVQSAQKGYLNGQWCIPCGHVEYDEHVEEAGIREFEEETGLLANITGLYQVDSNFFEPHGGNSVGIWFTGDIVGGELNASGDALDAQTFSLDDLPEKMCYKSDMRVIYRLCEERGFPRPRLS